MVAELPAHIPRLRFLEYITPTTQAPAEAVAEQMSQTETVFLKKHGVVVAGRTLQKVYDKTLVIEESARIYVYAKRVGLPQELKPEETDALKRELGSE